jgi:hypothetical protein
MRYSSRWFRLATLPIEIRRQESQGILQRCLDMTGQHLEGENSGRVEIGAKELIFLLAANFFSTAAQGQPGFLPAYLVQPAYRSTLSLVIRPTGIRVSSSLGFLPCMML